MRCWCWSRLARAREATSSRTSGSRWTLGLMLADLGVLIYFIHHVAISIQLPQVIASIARTCAGAIEAQSGRHRSRAAGP